MSLRFQIIALFAVTLVVTMGIAATLGARGASQAVAAVIRERAIEVARSARADLDLSRDLDPARAADRLAAAMRRHRGIRSAELLIRKPGKDDVVRIQYGPSGPEITFEQRDYAFPGQLEAELVGEGEGRTWVVTLPVKDSFNHTVAAVRVEAYLAEAEKLVASQRQVFFAVTALGALILVAAFTLILGRLLARPLSELSASMAAVESGALDQVRIPGVARQDEIGTVARGLEGMLARIRGFNRELQERIDGATADLARKNRALGELNDLLVEARRDLTAKERLAALGQISGTIAHELGNPLNAVSGHVQLLSRDPACPPAVKEELSVIENEVLRMTAIIRRFLDSARALTPAPEPVEVATLVDEALSLTLSAEERGRIEVRRVVPPEIGRVILDPALVRHVLTNFISNAVDAMAHGGRLLVQARRAGDQLLLSVSDTGPGISPGERKRIFEPFYTTKAPGQGTGLGLAISREIASALRGRIDVESQLGAGTTFTLVIPAPALRATG
jgi:two-component system NtrC family sensor kinase